MKIGKKIIAVGAALVATAMIVACGTAEKAPASTASGTATGTAIGYNGGQVSVAITMENGMITSVEVDHESETASFWGIAIAIVDDIKRFNDWDVDTISGATGSSTAIRSAAQSAIEQIKAASAAAPAAEDYEADAE